MLPIFHKRALHLETLSTLERQSRIEWCVGRKWLILPIQAVAWGPTVAFWRRCFCMPLLRERLGRRTPWPAAPEITAPFAGIITRGLRLLTRTASTNSA